MIDEFKNGARGRFIGIKEIDSSDCESTTNKFPVNDAWEGDSLFIYLPNHTETQGVVEIACNKSNWTIHIDPEFESQIESLLG